VFCACEIILLFTVVFCVVRAVHKCGFVLVIKKIRSFSDGDSCFDRIYMFFRDRPRECWGLFDAVRVSCFLLSK